MPQDKESFRFLHLLMAWRYLQGFLQLLTQSVYNICGDLVENSLKLAAIDIGSNSIKLAIVDAAASDSFAVIARDKEVVRLGQETLQKGHLAK